MTLLYHHTASYRASIVKPAAPRGYVGVALPPQMRARLEDAIAPNLLRELVDLHADGILPRRVCLEPSMVRRDPVLYGVVAQYVEHQVPVVLYCTLTPEAIRDASVLLSFGADRIFLFDVDDSAPRLASLAEDTRHAPITRELMRALSPWLERLPLGVRETAEAVIDAPERFFDAEDVAARARLSRRHVDRLFAVHGLAPAKHLVIACRAYVAVRLLATRASSINDAAELVGYDGQRGVRRQSESIWGLPPRAAALLPTDKLLRGIIEFTTRGQPRRY